MIKESLNNSFKQQFDLEAQVFAKSPGRINIIGEHTDYNNGFVLPAAIDKYIYVAIAERADQEIHLFSSDYNEYYTTTLSNTDTTATPEWAKYILGVSQIINQKTNNIKGFNLYLAGDVPLGAGLSSSAALSSAVGYALNELFSCGLTRIDLAKIGQQTEHEYIGLKCGIMDQFASVLGKQDHAIQLDCQDLSYQYIPIDWSENEVLLLNTNVKHNLASTAYNDRRNSCEQGVNWVKEKYPHVKSLRDITISQLDEIVKEKDTDTYTKCRFILEENQRLQYACEALKNKDIKQLGELLFAAHWALSKEYEVSCPELDYLVSKAEHSEYVLGARMMGGGFGGCTINIIKKGMSDAFVAEVSNSYLQEFGFALTPIHINLGEGSSLID